MRIRWIVVSLCGVLLFACSAGPKYRPPEIEVPDVYRGGPVEGASDLRSLADQSWSDVFQDEELRSLIGTALEQNYDARIATARILQARAQLGITRADQLPTLTGGVAATNQRIPASGPLPAVETSPTELSLALSWEADFWGRFRQGTEAARADLLAEEWARQAVVTTVIADVAAAYFQLRKLDLELEIARRTLTSREESLRLVRLQEEVGTASMLEVRQAEQLVHTAAAQIPDLERQIEQQENYLSILLGMNPSAIPRGRELTDQPNTAEVPVGLPSSLLERRPDIREAEQRLIAYNARVGVAETDYFPQVALTAAGGYRSVALSSLLSGPAGLWSLVGSLTQPIFAGGRIESGVALAEAQRQEVELVYRRTVLQAFQEVSDALVAHRKNRSSRVEQEQLADSAREAARLSDLRYRRGVANYLEVLDSDTRFFEAELGLAQARLNELLATVRLYKALGGGWQ